MKSVLFIGAGEIGLALSRVVGNRASVEMWDRHPDKVPKMKPLEQTVPDADIVFLCVPSWCVRDALGGIIKMLPRSAIVVSLAKGVEAGTLKTMDAILLESIPNNRFAILGGPLLAEELGAGLPGVGVFASKDKSAYDETVELFEGTNMRLEYSDDIRAVALAAVLKNIYAVGLGIVDGLGWGWNAKGWFCAKALCEMREIVQAFGEDPDVIYCSAGAGDFLATAMSPDSRNRTTGREIATTGACKELSEGCRAVESISAMLGGDVSRFELLVSLDQIINKHENAKPIFQNLLFAD
jgi:glycerol-3-phosphate dehydrogenase (NAD(P)+)